MKKLFSLLMCGILMLCFTSCTTENILKNQKLQIVTTIFPLYDFARQVGGEKADVTLLLGLPLDILHGASTVFFLYTCAPAMIEKIERIKHKFGIFKSS